ncbi:MAG: RagB/SusD family nutrient uptake outer membrane protein, partial [Bacteroidales bacterium]|nr:RagB/SusD family nutrient uptake outer membrane protein [Bacteroidales bacterium]
MKKTNIKIVVVSIVMGITMLINSCTKDLLDQAPTTQMDAAAFWKTEADATIALMGAYADVRPLFDRDYYLDGHGEYVRVRGTSTTNNNLRLGDAYQGADYNPTGFGDNFDKMYRHLYGGVNRTNYVIENVTKMLETANPSSVAGLETIIGEARLLRGMVYFRLISMWGDVPYFTKIIKENSEVASITRTPIAMIKDSILADLPML